MLEYVGICWNMLEYAGHAPNRSPWFLSKHSQVCCHSADLSVSENGLAVSVEVAMHPTCHGELCLCCLHLRETIVMIPGS